MKTKRKIIIAATILVSLTLFAGLFIGCSSQSKLSAMKSGAQLWSENCIRCHNVPSPDTFSDVDWDVAVTHMRVRANLTDDEARKIVDFLKTAN